MPREYRHIEQYEKEIIELIRKGVNKTRNRRKIWFNKQGPSQKAFYKGKGEEKKSYHAECCPKREVDPQRIA